MSGLIAAGMAATALAGLLTTVPAGPAGASAGASRALVESVVASAGGSTVGWRACAGEAELQCAAIEVPLDWSDPGGRKIALDLFRLPATGDRIGSVLNVPGGPGGTGREDIEQFGPDMTALRQRFDLVAYDPRNTDLVAKLPKICMKPAVTELKEPRTRAAYDAQAAAIGRAMRECARQDRSGLYTRLDSVQVARDMDAVRAALGERRLSFVANSYGGVPAAAYLRLFPGRVRAMYLDGAVNQPNGWVDQWLRSMRPAEEIFGRFTRWCAGTPACALHGEDAGKVWRSLTRRLDRDPLPVTSQQSGKGRLTGSYLRWWAFPLNPGPGNERWVSFAGALDKARRGDGSGFADFALGNARVWATPLALGMTCGDDRGYDSYAQYKSHQRRARQISPSIGGGVFDMLGCAGWPFPVANPVRPLPTTGLAPILGAGTWTDHPWVESLTRRVPGSVSILYDGPGHVLYLTGNRCAIGHATRYLIDLTLPPKGTVCGP